MTGEDAHHIVRVMRSEVGDTFICSDGVEREAVVRITALSKDSVTADIVEMLPWTQEPAVDVWIAQSLPKGDKLETVIQKGTEVGAARFLPFISERTVVQYDGKKGSEASRTLAEDRQRSGGAGAPQPDTRGRFAGWLESAAAGCEGSG